MKIIAVSACIAGVAHTYMAKSNLEKFAKKHDVEIKVETQGAMGIENKITDEDVKNADIVIFAVDTKVDQVERFDGKKIIEVGTNDVIKDGEKIILKAINEIK